MRQVWKFYLDEPTIEVSLPFGSEVIHVGSQRGRVAMWALVYPANGREVRRFKVCATGVDFSEPRGGVLYCGTAHVDPFVWHVFEVT